MPPLLLLPGMMCDARLWEPVVARLTGVTVVDGALTGGDSIAAIAEAVLAAAPARFALAGLSMGGIVAFELWRRAPARIAGLALMDTTAHPDANPHRPRQIAEVAAGGLARVMRDEMKIHYVHRAARQNAALMETVMTMALGLGPEVFAAQSRALMTRPDSAPTLATITVPTLILCGAADTLCPPALHRDMAAAISGSTLTILERAGHLAPLEAPAPTAAALVAWLGRISPPSIASAG